MSENRAKNPSSRKASAAVHSPASHHDLLPDGLHEARFATLARYVGLNAGHVESMRALAAEHPVDAEAIAESFYDHVLRQPDLRDIIERNSSVDRLRATLIQYVGTLFAGRYDDGIAEGRAQIGLVHDRIRLPLGAYLGAFVQIDAVVVRTLCDTMGHDPQALADALLAWRRVTQTDQAIVAQSFIDARDERLASLMESLTATSEEVAAQTEEATATVRETVSEAEAGSAAVSATADAVEGLRSAVATVDEQLGILRGQIEGIGSIVKEIGEISELTKLLSLNARIEAARAGDHGRGFAVVAEEVRRLAERTEDSLRTIASHNQGSTTSISEVAKALELAQSQVATVEDGAERSRQSFDKAASAVDEISGMIAEINGGMEGIVAQATRDNVALG